MDGWRRFCQGNASWWTQAACESFFWLPSIHEFSPPAIPRKITIPNHTAQLFCDSCPYYSSKTPLDLLCHPRQHTSQAGSFAPFVYRSLTAQRTMILFDFIIACAYSIRLWSSRYIQVQWFTCIHSWNEAYARTSRARAGVYMTGNAYARACQIRLAYLYRKHLAISSDT